MQHDSLIDTASLRTSIQRCKALEDKIHTLFPFETLRGKADPVLREALANYTNVILEIAHTLPPPEDIEALVQSAQALAPHPVFIMGLHRSGTTLMQRLLDHHPALAILPSEGTYLTNLHPRLIRLDDGDKRPYLIRRWIPRLIHPVNQPPYWTLGRTQGSHSPYLNFARYALCLYQRAHSLFNSYAPFQCHLAVVMACTWVKHTHQIDAATKYWVDKTPLNEFHVARLYGAFPEAKFIHVVRDPKAIFASRKKLDLAIFGSLQHPLRLLYKMRRSFHLALRHQARLGGATYRIVRYENVLDDLPGTMASLQTCLGIAEHDTLLQPTSSGVPCAANSSYRLPFAPGHVHKKAATSYQNMLTPAEHQLIESVTGRYARKIGYAIPSGSPMAAVAAAGRYAFARRFDP